MKKQLIIIMLIILMLGSTGCIDTYLGKDMLGGSIEKEKYKTFEKAEINYVFETVPPDSENTKYTDNRVFSIKKETSWIHIHVDYNQAGWSPVFYSVYRHVTVTVFSPDSNKYENRTYEDSDEDVIVIGEPASGEWGVEVESEGVGSPEYSQDSFTITVFAKEPI